MSFGIIYKNLKDGNFQFLLDNSEDQLKNLSSNKELEQVLGLCSHFLYNNNTISKMKLSTMMKIVFWSISKACQRFSDFNPTEILKSLHYILVHGIKKGMEVPMVLKMVKEIENILSFTKDSYLNNQELLKKMHSTLWNLSLQKDLIPSDSLRLQSYALGFVCLTGENLSEICSNCLKVGKLAEHNSCSVDDIEASYFKVLSALITILKRKPTISSSFVQPLNLVVIEYAKTLVKNNSGEKFSAVFKPLAAFTEPLIEPKIALGFKMSVKIIEMAMAWVFKKCPEDILMKILKGCSVISLSSLMANTVLIDGLFFAVELCDQGLDGPKNESNSKFSKSLLACLMDRITKDSKIAPESLLKVLELFGNRLLSFVTVTSNDPANKEELLAQALESKCTLENILPKVRNCKADTHIYNIGINSCNLGVISFKSNNYSVAADFLDVGVQFLYCHYSTCCESEQKKNVLNIIKKKSVLLRDSLRYSGRYEEATIKTMFFVALDLSPHSDIIHTWMKCQRDAHKANESSIKKLCIKDVYLRAISEETTRDTISNYAFCIEELLLEELKEIDILSHDTVEEELAATRALMVSQELYYALEGSLALTKILWANTALVSEDQSPMKVVKKILEQLESCDLQKKHDSNLIMEYKARAFFWLYLCNLQVIQQTAETEVEEKQKLEEPLTAQSTDLGEEVQPNDACSVRPSTTVTTFSTQELTLQYLHQALHCWELVLKSKSVHHPSLACNDLLSIGFVYKLSGLLPSSVKAFSLIIEIAQKYELTQFWVHGVRELMEIIPEVLSVSVADRLRSLLSDGSFHCTDYFKFSSLAALAYYYLRNGKYASGAEIISDCLSNPLMEKRTLAATEVQILIYYVASHFAFLPSSVLPQDLKPTQPCMFLAQSATRKAIALISALTDSRHQGNICQRHKIAWLHHKANLWFGQLCYTTAQPRVARAFLRQALMLAEKLALPLRTVELLCILTEIDLLCEQLDDCRVKIDSLHQLFEVHSAIETQDFTKANSLILSNQKCMKEKTIARLPPTSVPIYVDGEDSVSERLRESGQSPEFNLQAPRMELGHQLLVIGQEKRIPQMAANVHHSQNLGSTSPSVRFQEEKFVVRLVNCPSGWVDCSVCLAPELHSAVIRTTVLMGVIHTQRNNEKGAQLCFNQAQKETQKLQMLSKKTSDKLRSILRRASSPDLVVVSEEEFAEEGFLTSHLAVAKLSFLFHRNEAFCISQNKWGQMEKLVQETLEDLAGFHSIILCLNHPLVLQLLLQGHSITRTLQKKEKDDYQIPISESSPVLKPINRNQPRNTPLFKTPLKSSKKTYKAQPPSSCSKPPATPFRIFTDKNESTAAVSVKSKKSEKSDEVKNLLNSFGKLTFSENSLDEETNKLDGSPFSQVLQLPSKPLASTTDEATTGKRVAKGTRGRTRKTTVEAESTSSGLNGQRTLKMLLTQEPSSHKNELDSKENSPIIDVKLNPRVKVKPNRTYVKTTGPKTYTSRSTSKNKTVEVGKTSCSLSPVRETRCRRNPKRL